MKKGGVGGAKTAKAGANFEDQTLQELLDDLEKIGYVVDTVTGDLASPRQITLNGPNKSVVELFFKASLHKQFFEPRGVNSSNYFTARLEPDTAIFSNSTQTLTIIEKKQQTGPGSVAEKLQTCDYKMLYYKTLCEPLNVKVNLVWQLGSYFKENEERLGSVFEYMISKGSTYHFGKIPVEELQL